MASSIPTIITNVFSVLFHKQDNISGFVIDTSICGIENPKALFERLVEISDSTNCRKKIILTTVTIDELDRLQKRSVENSEIARAILTAATNDRKHYLSVKINTAYKLADDCILHFCRQHKSSITLLTADKAMYLKANAMSIDANLYKSVSHQSQHRDNNTRTLFYAKIIDGALSVTSSFKSLSTAVRVISDGVEYDIPKTSRSHKLSIGDDVLVINNKGSYISFYHFRMTSLHKYDNCEVVCHRRIHNSQDIANLPKASYKNFLKDFVCKRQIKLKN